MDEKEIGTLLAIKKPEKKSQDQRVLSGALASFGARCKGLEDALMLSDVFQCSETPEKDSPTVPDIKTSSVQEKVDSRVNQGPDRGISLISIEERDQRSISLESGILQPVNLYHKEDRQSKDYLGYEERHGHQSSDSRQKPWTTYNSGDTTAQSGMTTLFYWVVGICGISLLLWTVFFIPDIEKYQLQSDVSHIIRTQAPEFFCRSVIFYSDNATSPACVRKIGNTTCPALLSITEYIWIYCMKLYPKISDIRAIYAETMDAPSRLTAQTEFPLTQATFQRINKIWVPQNVDLFESSAKKKIVSCYF
ncbi:hypothetical protein AYI70_g2316 [Smittium culicis]|uniref:Uncharacterized protein n=1 Tax=Smittium culicis TaxID=133412 RepID=A0A1R1Y8R9_9FUNG|nr:hypothetical protein AYI70_g2316 [Smittium culicis]